MDSWAVRGGQPKSDIFVFAARSLCLRCYWSVRVFPPHKMQGTSWRACGVFGCFLDLSQVPIVLHVYASLEPSYHDDDAVSPSVRSSRRQSCVAEHNSEASHKRKPKKRQSGRSQEILCLSRLADEGRARARTHVASRSKRARSLSPATRTRSVRARTCQRGVHIQFDH